MLKFFTEYNLSFKRINNANSLPLFHLLWEWALRAIGIVLHAKVLVDLKQALLTSKIFQELFPAWVASEKSRRRCFKSAIR